MLRRWQVSHFNNFRILGFILLVIASTIFSCTVPKKYQKGKPFIYKTEVDVTTESLTNIQKQDLKERLANQIHDSLKVRTVVALRWTPPFFYNRLLSPPVFDTAYLGLSKTYMDALLQSQGFFNPVITDTFLIDTVKNQQRVAVKFNVETGKLLRYDSIGFDLADTTLQRIVTQSNSRTNLKVNDGYALANVASELDRMVVLFRNNGYYKLSKDDLYAEHDTVVAGLIDPTIDPFEQLQLLDSLQKKKENPTIAITFKQRDSMQQSHLETYRIGNVTIYPELKILEDSLEGFTRSKLIDSFRFRYNTDRFKLRFLARNVHLKPGALYRLSDYYKTLNTFSNLGAWQQANVDLIERRDSSRTLDAIVRLYPAQKQSLNVAFETSLNSTDVYAGNLFGLGLNFGLTNRNAFRESIQSSSNLRAGVEFGKIDSTSFLDGVFVQTIQTSFSQTFSIPRFILPFNIKTDTSLRNARTIASYNMAYTDRRLFFTARSVNFSWGYEWGKRTHTWRYIPFNFEYTNVTETDSLNKLQQEIPTLAYAFNTGLIMSQILTYNKFWLRHSQRQFFQGRLEESGGLFGFWKKLEQGDLRRFVKVDVEYKHYFDRKSSTWAFRAFAGVGFAYGETDGKPEYTLPFFKAYYGGGPYSLRGWRVRYAGLGSNKTLDTITAGPVERYGDVKLEGNVEYRFTAGKVWGIKVQGSLFTDIGNIWLRSDQGDPKLAGAAFKLSRLYTDLAVASGISARLDFDFFLIRFDWAYKVKDPFYSEFNRGWFHDLQLGDGQFQLGIGYPF